jgi:hypothetical protein
MKTKDRFLHSQTHDPTLEVEILELWQAAQHMRTCTHANRAKKADLKSSKIIHESMRRKSPK